MLLALVIGSQESHFLLSVFENTSGQRLDSLLHMRGCHLRVGVRGLAKRSLHLPSPTLAHAPGACEQPFVLQYGSLALKGVDTAPTVPGCFSRKPCDQPLFLIPHRAVGFTFQPRTQALHGSEVVGRRGDENRRRETWRNSLLEERGSQQLEQRSLKEDVWREAQETSSSHESSAQSHQKPAGEMT